MTKDERMELRKLADAAINDGVIHRDNAFSIVKQTPALLDRIDQLERQNQEMREALEDLLVSPDDKFARSQARKALGEQE